jgi:hypothetical protein
VDGFAAAMAAETWYTPDEAIAAGLADELAPSAKANSGAQSSGAQACARWDLSAYGVANVGAPLSEPGSPPAPPLAPAPVAQAPEPQLEPEDDHDARARRHAVRMLTTTA